MANNVTDVASQKLVQELDAINGGVTAGFRIAIGGFKLGAATTAFNAAATNLPGGVVYTGLASQIRAARTVDPRVINYHITLDESVGDFVYGSVGLYLASGELFTYAPLFELRTKTATDSPEKAGNVHRYMFPVSVLRSDVIFSLQVDPPDHAALPEVANVQALPDPATAPYKMYLVLSDSGNSGDPSVAITAGLAWKFPR